MKTAIRRLVSPNRFLLPLAMGLAALPAAAQCYNWQLQAAPPGPAGRTTPALVYDSNRHVVILHGGSDGVTPGGPTSTWEFDGQLWTQRATNGPGFQSVGSAAFDPGRGVMVMILPNRIVYEYHGATGEWTTPGPTGLSPGTGGNMLMAYDEARGRLTALREGTGVTYSWDGAVWTTLTTVGPPVRLNASLAYDRDRARMVMAGGTDFNSQPLTDTWEWDGAVWALRGTIGAPASLGAQNVMVYDAARHRALITSPDASATYQWDGVLWTQVLATGPAPARNLYSVVYDDARARTVLFGGEGAGGAFFSELWAINPTVPLFLVQPAGIAAVQGRRATLAVQCAGTVQGYQWRKNGVAIPGATFAVYSIPSPTPADAGTYDVQVTGGCATVVTSAAAALTVQCEADVDNSGSLNVNDFVWFLNRYAAGCP